MQKHFWSVYHVYNIQKNWNIFKFLQSKKTLFEAFFIFTEWNLFFEAFFHVCKWKTCFRRVLHMVHEKEPRVLCSHIMNFWPIDFIFIGSIAENRKSREHPDILTLNPQIRCFHQIVKTNMIFKKNFLINWPNRPRWMKNVRESCVNL